MQLLLRSFFLLYFSLSVRLSKPIGSLFLTQKPSSDRKSVSAELISLSVHTSLKAKKQVPPFVKKA